MSDLTTAQTDRLRAAPLTYAEVGATLGELPPGYHQLRAARLLGSGVECLERSADAVLSWRMHRGAGVSVRASGPVAQDAVALLGVGWGLRVHAPVRVVRVVEEERRRGFAYGTLPGHPECGEECFVVEMDQRGQVRARITAFSRPGTRLARSVGPLGGVVQRLITARYLRAAGGS